MRRTLVGGLVGLLILLTFFPGGAGGGLPPVSPVNRTRGYWEGAFDWDETAVHLCLLRGSDTHSRLVFWARGPGARTWAFNPLDTLGATAALFEVPTNNSDIFCGGHSTLADGRLLVTGGTEIAEIGIDHVNIFDPALPVPAWVSPRPRNMIENRYYPTSTTLRDGTVLVTGGSRFQEMEAFGGEAGGGPSNSVLVLGLSGQPVVPTATPSGVKPVPRTGHAMAFDEFSNVQTPVAYRHLQRALVIGGRDAFGIPLNDVWALYRDELLDWSWVSLNPLPDPTWGFPPPRSGHSAVVIPADSCVLIFGGLGADSTVLGDLWKLYPRRGSAEQGEWRKLDINGADSRLPRFGHTAVYDDFRNRLLVFGGRNPDLCDSTVWELRRVVLIPDAGGGPPDRHRPDLGDGSMTRPRAAPPMFRQPEWAPLAVTGTAPPLREGHVALYDGEAHRRRMLVYGGADDGAAHGDLWQLDLNAIVPEWLHVHPELDPAHGEPVARTRLSAFQDPVHDRWLLLGGDGNGPGAGGFLGDLWQLRLEPEVADTGGAFSGFSPRPLHDDDPGPVGPPGWERLFDNLVPGGLAGSAAVVDPRWIQSSVPELFYPAFDFWLPLSGARRWMPLYPFMFLLPSSKVFFASYASTGILNVDAGAWETFAGAQSPFFGGSAVMYRPGKIMKCGDPVSGSPATAAIDLSGDPSAASWRSLTAGPSLIPRTEHNLTLLPTGQVIVTGGLGQRIDIFSAVRAPQIWNPDTETWTSGSLLLPDPARRDYHSTALLLPDGRILSAGGDLLYFPTDRDRYTATIYWPPYLFDAAGALAPRPAIAGAPATISAGSALVIQTPDAANIASVCLMRPGSVTHAFNQGQSYVPLAFVAGAGQITATVPSNANLLPAGDVLLFLLNQNSVPSIGRWIRVVSAGARPASLDPRSIVITPTRNPFRESTALNFRMEHAGVVSVTVFDAAGRPVRNLFDGVFPAGPQSVTWDGRNDAGRRASYGVYFARLDAGEKQATVKLILKP